MYEIKPGMYQHFRTGKTYEVIGIARLSEDPHKEYVIYKQLYESLLQPEGTKIAAGTLWARPKEMFLEVVTGLDGKRCPVLNKYKFNHREIFYSAFF